MLRKLIAVLFGLLFFTSNASALDPNLTTFLKTEYSDYVTHKEYQGSFNVDGTQDYLVEIKRKLVLISLDDINIPIPTLTTYAIVLDNGDGTFNKIQEWGDQHLGIDWQSVKQVLIGDFNHDLRDDILLIGSTTYLLHANSSSMFIGDSNGNPDQQWSDGHLGINWSQASSYTVSDVNGDGRADVTLVFPDKTIAVMSDNGGTFSSSSETELQLNRRTGTLVAGQSGGAFDVDANGAATYSMPIAVPPGMAGMQPSLSINYSSQGGNGLLGMGWSLGGLSVIHRCPQTYAQDGSHKGINFDNNDRLCLDGQRLVVVTGNYGQAGATYRTEIDSFSRITQNGGDLTSASTSFTVETKAGQTLEYGTSGTDSNFQLNGQTATFVWAVKTLQDAVDNTITVSYVVDSALGSQYVSSISYLSLSNGTAEVRFNYEDRPDDSSGYVLGSKVTTNKRLANIETYVDSSFVRSVELYYDQSPSTNRSRMTKLQECAYDGTCLAAVDFTFQTANVEVPNSASESSVCANSNCGDLGSVAWNQVLRGDIDGNGKVDLCYPSSNAIYCALNNNGSFSAATVFINLTQDNRSALRLVDMDSDGKADLINHRKDLGLQIFYSTGTAFTSETRLDILVGYIDSDSHACFDIDPNDGNPDYSTCLNNTNSGVGGLIKIGDVDGDALPDICYKDYYNFTCLKNQDNRAFAPLISKKYCSSNDPDTGTCHVGTIKLVDINVDGMSDLVYLDDYPATRVLYRLSNGSGFDSVQVTDICYNACDSDNWDTVQFADVTGDGLPDACYRNDTQGILCTVNTGNGFDSSNTFAAPACSNLSNAYGICNDSDNYSTIQFGDINADGKADVIYRSDSGVRAWLSTGSSFAYYPAGVWGSDLCANSVTTNCDADNYYSIAMMDMNGDGLIDLSYRSDGGVNVYYATGSATENLINIKDGYNNQTSITYSTLNDASVYGLSAVCLNGYQERCIENMPMPVVQSYTASNGVGGSNSYAYQYFDLRMHLRGRGMLGFGSVWKKDVVNNTSTHTWYDNSTAIATVTSYPDTYPNRGMPTVVKQIAPNGTVVSETTNTLTHDNTFGAAIFPYFAQSVEVTRDPSGSLVSTTTSTNTYDATDIQYGDISTVVVETVDHVNVATFTKTVTNDYYPVTGWKLGRLSSTSVIHSAFGKTETRNSSFTYNVDGLLETSIEEPGDTNLAVTTTYSYDDYGNKSSVTVEGGLSGATYPVAPRSTSTVLTVGGADAQVQTTNALGHTEIKLIDTRHGGVKSLMGPNGLETTWDYDGFGRKLSETRADGTSTTINRSLCSGCSAVAGVTPSYYVSTQSSGGVPKTVYYDQLGRELRGATQDVNGNLIYKDTVYNSKGQVTKVSAPYFTPDSPIWTYYTYDDVGRVKTQTDPGGTVTTNTYGLLLTQTEVERKSSLTGGSSFLTTTKRHYANGKVREITDAEGGITNFEYDAVGNLTRTLAPGEAAGSTQIATEMAYDKKDRKIGMIDPDMGTWSYEYDALGKLRQQTDAKGNIVNMLYDDLGRMIVRLEYEVDSGAYYASSWEYYETYTTSSRSKGKLFRETGPITITQAQQSAILASATPVADVLVLKTSATHQRAYTYDEMGRSSSATTTIDGIAYAVDTAYDSLSRVSTITYPQNVQNSRFSVEYLYSSNGFLTQVRNAATPATVYWCLGGSTSCGSGTVDTSGAFNARGQLEEYSYGNNLVTYRSHNANTGLVNDIITSNPWVQNNHSVFDSIGNLELRSDENTASFDGSGKFRETFSYDKLNRLTSMTLYGKVAESGQITSTLDYYANGNIKYRSGLGYYQYNPVATGVRPHAVNDITSDAAGTTSVIAGAYTYDANGNMTSGNDRGMSYTSFNKPYQIVRVVNGEPKIYNFDYAADRSRYRQDTPDKTITYVRGGARFEREVLKSTGAVQDVHYITAGSLVIGTHVVKAAESYMRYYHYDHLGSISVITDDVANVVERLGYSAFGQRRDAEFWTPSTVQIVAQQTNYGFTGHEHIDQVGLIHMNGRVYDPQIGRFVSADPHIQAPHNSQSYNRYSYVLNNPLSMTDPSGYFFSGLKKAIKKVMRKVKPYAKVIMAAYIAYITAGAASGAVWAANTTVINGVAVYTASVASITTTAAIAGGVAGGFVSGAILGGNIKSAVKGALVGGVFGAANGLIDGYGYEHQGFSGAAKEVALKSFAGGIANRIYGKDFGSGFASNFTSSLFDVSSRAMRRVMIRQSKNLEVNSSGESVGYLSDGFKLAGCRRSPGCTSPDPLGGFQGGEGKFLFWSYNKGDWEDYLAEAFAGPHDYLNSKYWYNVDGSAKLHMGIKSFLGEALSAANVVVATPFVLGSVYHQVSQLNPVVYQVYDGLKK